MNKCHACCILSHEFPGMQKEWRKAAKRTSAEVMGSDNGKLNRRSTRFGQWKAKSTESTEGTLNPIFKPGGKFSYLRVSCYFDINCLKHNLHQSGGKLLTLDFCP